MSATWRGAEPLPPARIGPGGWVRAVMRGAVLGGAIFGGLGLLLLARLIERPLCGPRRPVTPYITQCVCRAAFVILGIAFARTGAVMRGHGAVVANHVSWLDIFALNACQRIRFVSKSEVAGWPAIGWLARATGTVFIRRDAKEARAQTGLLARHLAVGERLLFFPEGTSTDGVRVLPFKPTLFAALFQGDLDDALTVQPVTVVYRAPSGEPAPFYGWWGDMGFGAHLLKVLAARRQGSVRVIFHPPVRVADFADRKALACHCETAVRGGFGRGSILPDG